MSKETFEDIFNRLRYSTNYQEIDEVGDDLDRLLTTHRQLQKENEILKEALDYISKRQGKNPSDDSFKKTMKARDVLRIMKEEKE